MHNQLYKVPSENMEYKHFSHSHNLIINGIYQLGLQVNCSGCDSPCDNTKAPVHACRQCNFFLHDHCADARRYVKHPAHESHPLNLYPYPTYASNTFFCEACGLPGKSFSYCCTLCEFDLHVGCAFLPFTVTHQAHQHQLTLFNKVPETHHKYCSVCKNVMDAKTWAYCCEICNFSVHTRCATTEVAPELYHDDSPVSSLVQGHVSKPYGGGGGGLNPHSWGGGKSKPHGGGGGNSKPHSGAGGGNVGRVDMSTLYDMRIQAMCDGIDRMNNII